MSRLPDALFPPLDENGDEEIDEESTERHIYSLLHSIQSNPQPASAAVTAAVLIQHEIDRWKRAIDDLERRVESTPAVILDNDSDSHTSTTTPKQQPTNHSYVTDDSGEDGGSKTGGHCDHKVVSKDK